jgi:hypothetical protein
MGEGGSVAESVHFPCHFLRTRLELAIMVDEFWKMQTPLCRIFASENVEEVKRESALWCCVTCFFGVAEVERYWKSRNRCNVAEVVRLRKTELSRVQLPEIVGPTAHWACHVCAPRNAIHPHVGRVFNPATQQVAPLAGLKTRPTKKDRKPPSWLTVVHSALWPKVDVSVSFGQS